MNKNRILLFAATVFVALITVSACKKNEAIEITSFDQAKEALVKYSKGLEKEWYKDATIPQQNMFCDTRVTERKLIFTQNGEQHVVKYKYGSNRSCVKISDTDKAKSENALATIIYALFGDNDNEKITCERLNSIGAIDTYNNDYHALSVNDLTLSMLYNTVVGDTQKHVGIEIKENRINRICSEDFPRYYIDTTRFISFINEHLKDNFARLADSSFVRTLKDSSILVEIPQYDFPYFNFRKDSVFVGSVAYSVKDYDLSKINNNPELQFIAKPDGTLVKVDDIFPSNRYYVDIDEGNLSKAQFNRVKDKGFSWIWIVLIAIGGCIILGTVVYGVIMFLNNRKDSDETGSDDSDCSKDTQEKEAPEDDPQNEEPIAKDINELLSSYDAKHGTDFNNEYNSVVKSRDAHYAAIKSFSTVAKDPSIEKVLTAYEKHYPASDSNHSLVMKFKGMVKDLKDAPDNAKAYKKLVDCTTEQDVLDVLAEFRKQHANLPEIQSLSAAYSSCENKLKDTVKDMSVHKKNLTIIRELLGMIDKASASTLSSTVQAYVDSLNEYAQCKKYLSVKCEKSFANEFMPIVEEFANSEQTITDCVKFATKFKSPEGNPIKKADEILDKYKKCIEAIDEFKSTAQSLITKDKLDFWDRIALSIWSVSKGILPILKVLESEGTLENNAAVYADQLKNDLLTSYVMRYFLRSVSTAESTPQQFNADVESNLHSRVASFNTYVNGDNVATIKPDSLKLNDTIKTLYTAVEKARKYEKSDIFINKMWDNFVKDFLEKARDCNDKSFILENALNIAYHTADFLECIQGGSDISICYNYNYLVNDFKMRESNAYEFKYNDITRSSAYSNFIYALAEEENIEHLKILVDNYLVRP